MTFRWLPKIVALLAVAVAVSTFLSWAALSKISTQAHRNTVAASALCTLRHNLERRGQQGNDFLREHPNGLDGITRAVIVKSIRDTRASVRALNNLKC